VGESQEPPRIYAGEVSGKRRSTSAQQYPLTIKRIAEFLASVETEEQFGIQRLCDAESRDILQAIDLSYAAQISLFQGPSSPLSPPDEDEGGDDENTVDDAEIYGDYE
jgi:hypothetical protein